MSRLIILAFLILFRLSAGAQNIEIYFEGIRSVSGMISVSVFLDDRSFQAEKPFKTFKFNKSGVKSGSMAVSLSLEPGIYGLALLDDENEDEKMEYNFFGIPEEGFGFSNFYLTGLKRPKFEQFKFYVNKNQKVKIQMKIRYM